MGMHAIIRENVCPETCPTIDRIRDSIKNAQRAIPRFHAARLVMDEDDLREVVDQVEHELDGLLDLLESVRDANGALRDALAEEMRRTKTMEDQYEELGKDFNALREQVKA